MGVLGPQKNEGTSTRLRLYAQEVTKTNGKKRILAHLWGNEEKWELKER